MKVNSSNRSEIKINSLMVEHVLPCCCFLGFTLVFWFWFPWIAYSCIGTDAAFANGAQINYFELKEIFADGDRRLERLPSIIPGYIIFNIFSPVEAHEFLFLLTSTLIAYCFFRTARFFSSCWTSLLIGLLLLSTPWVIGTTNSFYVNRELLVYSGFALLLTLHASTKQKNEWYLAALGLTYALAAFTHPISIVFLGYSPIFYLITKRFPGDRLIPRGFHFCVWVMIGFTSTFLTLGSLNKFVLGNSFNFLATQSGLAGSIYANYFREFSFVFSHTIPLSFAFLGFSGALMPIIFRSKYETKVITFALSFLIYVAVYAAGYLANSFFPEAPILIIALWLGYYYPLMVPVCLFAMALPIFQRKEAGEVGVLFIICLLVMIVSPEIFGFRERLFSFIEHVFWPTFVSSYTGFMIFFGLICFLIAALMPAKKSSLSFALSLVLIVGTVFHQSSERKGSCHEDELFYGRIYEGNRIIKQANLQKPQDVIFWIADDGKPKQRREYYHIAWLWLHYRVINHFGDPTLAQENPLFLNLFVSGQEFVFLDHRKDLIGQARKIFCKRNVGFEILQYSEIGLNDNKFNMLIGRTQEAPNCNAH